MAQGRHQRAFSQGRGDKAWIAISDTILLEVEPLGPACHTNATSCFFNGCFLSRAEQRTGTDRRRDGRASSGTWSTSGSPNGPEGSYVAKLAAGGVDRFAKKVGEEATEVVIAAKNHDNDELTREMADLWFHCYSAGGGWLSPERRLGRAWTPSNSTILQPSGSKRPARRAKEADPGMPFSPSPASSFCPTILRAG